MLIKKLIQRIAIIGIICLAACSPAAVPPTPTATFSPSPPPTEVPTGTPTALPVPTATIQPTSEGLALVWKIDGGLSSFGNPIGVTVDPQGNVYVLDQSNSKIQKFDSNGNYLLEWGSLGKGEGQFDFLMGDPDVGRLAADSQGNIYVADIANSRIEKFDGSGKFLLQWGSNGTGDGQFSNDVADIAIDKQDNIYVADYGYSTVSKFDTSGKFLLKWGSPGNEPGQFPDDLFSITTTPDGNVITVDKTLMQKFDANGNFIASLPWSFVNGHFMIPMTIASDDQGNLYFADYSNRRIIVMNPDWQVIAVWTGPDAGTKAFGQPEDVAVDAQGNLYLTDVNLNAVFKFHQ